MPRTVIYFLDSVECGGTEQVVLHLLAGLDRRRWRPVLFHRPEPGLAPLLERAEDLDVTLREVPRVQERRSLVVRVPHLIGELRAENPAVFHAHLNYPSSCRHALIAAGLAGVPAVVATVHLFPEGALGRLSSALQRLAAPFIDSYIAVSHEVARRLHQQLHIPTWKIYVVHNGVAVPDGNAPVNATLRAALTGGRARPVVLIAARLDKQKGHRYLLEATPLVPEAVFVLAGEGPERASLEAQARALGVSDRVLFLGYRRDIPDLLACADLVVLPSLFEGLPLSVLEAMAAGKPVIASAIPGTTEVVIHGETGLLVPPGDPAALAAAIRTVLSDAQLAQRLAEAGRARVHRQFSAPDMVQRVAQIYEHVLSHGGEADGRRYSHA